MSVISEILKTAALRLTAIESDSGYSFDVPKVWLPKQDAEEYTPKHLHMVVTAGEIVPEPEHDRPGNPPAVGRRLPIQCRCDLIPSQIHGTETFDQLASIVESNMMHALTNWPDWYKFGGFCINSEPSNPVTTKPQNSGGIGSVMVTIDAIYRVSETNFEQTRG